MKTLFTLVLLLIGLVGFTQTSTHQQITGAVFTQPNCRLSSPYNEINVQLFEVDTVTNLISQISPNGYTLGWSLNGASGYYNYMIMIANTQTKPVIVKMTPNRGTCAHSTYQPTFAPWSLNTRGAAKIVFPRTPLGTVYFAVQNVYLIPQVLRNPNVFDER